MIKFDRSDNFGLWQRRVKDILMQQGIVKAFYGQQSKDMDDID